MREAIGAFANGSGAALGSVRGSWYGFAGPSVFRPGLGGLALARIFTVFADIGVVFTGFVERLNLDSFHVAQDHRLDVAVLVVVEQRRNGNIAIFRGVVIDGIQRIAGGHCLLASLFQN